MVKDISLEACYMIGMACGWSLYGFYACLFLLCLRVVQTGSRGGKIVMWAMIAVFSFTSAHIVLQSIITYDGFVKYRLVPGTQAYFSLYHRPVLGADLFMYWSANTVTESLLLWRVWVVWFGTRRIYIVFPTVLYVVTTIVSFYSMIVHLILSIHSHDNHNNRTATLTALCGGLVLLQNLITTFMIAGRLWYMGRLVTSKHSRFPYGRIISAVVESSTIYSAALLGAVVVDVLKLSNYTTVFVQLTSVLVGIAPTLIVCAINLKHAAMTTSSNGSPLGNISPRSGSEAISTVLRFRPPTHGIDLELSQLSSGSGTATGMSEEKTGQEKYIDERDYKAVDLAEASPTSTTTAR